MKLMIRLTVFMATVLLMSAAAFANGSPCYYYEYTYSNLDYTEKGTACVELCFDLANHSGNYSGLCGDGNQVLFFDPMHKQALLYSGDTAVVVGHLSFHGDWLHVFTGILYCEPNPEGGRYEIRGNKVESCKIY